MTPEEMFAVDQTRCEQQQIAAEAMYWEGAEDVMLAHLPRYLDSVYLEGYINTLKKLPTYPDGTLCYADSLPPRSPDLAEEF
jgi:hypothetical protein